ncbi:MAG: TMEM165/GDT1 family protein [candidate division NC10 bacterium]|nr:TMEM165/GDT1 family protein [candidate division NC10 bacterium]
MTVLLKALFVIAVAEMGDKTQLLTLAFATRLSVRHVLGGVLLGTLANHALAVAVGGAVLLIVPVAWVKLAAGLAFIGFGLWTLRGDQLSGSEEKRFGYPLLTVAVSFFLAEMGDKTQLATAVLAAEAAVLVPVWLGSSLGMVVADGLAIGIGVVLGRRLPERMIKVGATFLFVLFGLLLFREGLTTTL